MTSDQRLLDRAASCYLRVGEVAEAARCYRESGAFRRAADLYARLGLHHDAAGAYAEAGLTDVAAWHLAHYAGDPAAARRLDPPGRARTNAADGLRWRLALARCDVAEARPDSAALRVLVDVCSYLERPGTLGDPYLEPWAVALAGSLRREDQVALVFAAAVRGRRVGAADRWAAWSREVLHCALILPAAEPASADPNPH